MSGLTKDGVLALERRTRAALEASERLRQQVNETLEQIQTAQQDDSVQIQADYTRKAEALEIRLTRVVDTGTLEARSFLALGFLGRLRWLLLGKVTP